MKLTQLLDMDGSTAIITGGLGHLGLAISETLLEMGVNAIITGTPEEAASESAQKKLNDLMREFPGRLIVFETLNFKDNSSVKNFFVRVQKSYPSVNVLVNCAFYGVSKPAEEMSFDEFSDGINGSLASVFKCCQSVLPLMKTGGGSIINIASMYGIVAPDSRVYKDCPIFNNPINYGASKAGVIQMTKYLASYWAKYGIRVNSISPGPFPDENIVKDPAFIASLKEKTMLGRIGVPEDLKGAIALLASNASGYITGQNLIVDGGWTAW